jgi:hypothetical protein
MVGMASIGVERTEASWLTAHEALSRLARQRATADAEEGRWLLAAQRAATHVHFGFGSFVEYAERLFGYKPRSTHEKLRVAEALEHLPALASALEEGRLSWSAVRELSRVAVAETQSEWLALAMGKSLRQLEELVAGKPLGAGPSAAPDPAALRHVLRFEVRAETFALMREALAELRRRSDAALDDDAALLEMARHVTGLRDEGRSSYQIALSLCPECSSARQAVNGKLVRIAPELVEMARCDGQHLPSLESVTGLPSITHVGAPAKTARVDPPFAPAASDPAGPRMAHVGAPAKTSCASQHLPPSKAISTTHTTAHAGARAKQSIPPAVRRTVLHRDQHRCRVPGCANATFLDVHHLQLRSEGGEHVAANLITVCSAHHRALHRGQLRMEGTSGSLHVSHADGQAYGQTAAPQRVDVQTQVFGGLRGLGFREHEVRGTLAELRRRDELRDATAEQWLREALRLLHRPQARSPVTVFVAPRRVSARLPGPASCLARGGSGQSWSRREPLGDEPDRRKSRENSVRRAGEARRRTSPVFAVLRPRCCSMERGLSHDPADRRWTVRALMQLAERRQNAAFSRWPGLARLGTASALELVRERGNPPNSTEGNHHHDQAHPDPQRHRQRPR